MHPFTPVKIETVRVLPGVVTRSTPTGAPGDATFALVSATQPCMVVFGNDDDTPLIADLNIQFKTNPQDGDLFIFGLAPTSYEFRDTPTAAHHIQRGGTMLDTIDNLMLFLRSLGYAANTVTSGSLLVQAINTPGYPGDQNMLVGQPYMFSPPNGNKVWFNSGSGVLITPGDHLPFQFSPEDRCYVFGVPGIAEGVLTVTWATIL